MSTLFFELALTGYLIASIIGAIDLFRKKSDTAKLTIYCTAAAFILHTVAIILRYAQGGHLPVTSMHEAASFFAWCIALIFFFLILKYRIGILVSFIVPIVFFMMLASAFMPRASAPLDPLLQSPWLWIHALFAFTGIAAFGVACGTGVMYLIQHHYLKSKHLGNLFQSLPSLQVMDEINQRLLNLGFPLFTMAIITGALWAESVWGKFWRWDPKEVWSLITWLIYALIFHLRYVSGWKQKRAAMLSILGFAAVLFTFFGVNLIMKSLHSFQ
jgi:cytochrome c-type biogenesis protein CcsB